MEPIHPDDPASPNPTDAQLAAIDAELRAGRKIQAIKLIREATNAGLKEAKDFAEEREAQLRQQDPASFAKPAGKGCLGVLAALCLAVALAVLAAYGLC